MPFPSPGDPPDPGTRPASPASAGGFSTAEPPGSLYRGKFTQPCYPSHHCTASVTADDPARNRLGRAQGRPSQAWRSLTAGFGKEGLNRRVTTWHRYGFGQATAALPSRPSPRGGDPGFADPVRPQGRFRTQWRGIVRGLPTAAPCPSLSLPTGQPHSLPGWVCPSHVRRQTRPGPARRVPGTPAKRMG